MDTRQAWYLENSPQGALWRMRQHEDGEVFEEAWADVPPSHGRHASCHEGEILNILWEEGKGRRNAMDGSVDSEMGSHVPETNQRFKTFKQNTIEAIVCCQTTDAMVMEIHPPGSSLS